MSATEDRPMRADARRNRATILSAAAELLAARGGDVQMEEIADAAGLGMGTLYRHFATKQDLVAAIVSRRFEEMIALAQGAAELSDPWEAFETLLRTYLEAAERDRAYRRTVLGPDPPDWDRLAAQKAEFNAATESIIARVTAAGLVRPDFTQRDFVLVTRGVMANMIGAGEWRRHLELTLAGLSGPGGGNSRSRA